jgi:hypothetical protein
MQLNLPILEALEGRRNVLVAGMGGGFDVFCGMPILLTLQQAGFQVHLANLSFSDVANLRGGQRLSPSLLGVNYAAMPAPDATSGPAQPGIDPDRQAMFAHWGAFVYFPELFLSQWFAQELGQDLTVWCFAKTGARPLLAGYRQLIRQLGIDAIVLIDGGVDSLARGDEHQMGTIVEDGLSLAVVNELDEVPVRIVGCLGLGAEEHITYAHIFENIAALTSAGGFLGACALAPQMEAARRYAALVEWVHAWPFQDPSVINASVVSALQGHFGDFHLTEKTRGSRLWISPLMALYWFFDLPTLASHNLLLTPLLNTDTANDALRAVMAARQHIRVRSAAKVPI